jgi:hypothetical protein
MFAAAAKSFGFASSHLETLRRLRADLPIGQGCSTLYTESVLQHVLTK